MDGNENYSIPHIDSSALFPRHKHFFDINVENYKTPKSRDGNRREPRAFAHFPV